MHTREHRYYLQKLSMEWSHRRDILINKVITLQLSPVRSEARQDSLGALQGPEICIYGMVIIASTSNHSYYITWSANPKPEAIGHTRRASQYSIQMRIAAGPHCFIFNQNMPM